MSADRERPDMAPDEQALRELIEDYLDGALGRADVRRLEARLLEPEVSRLLSEALMLRELLATGLAEGDPDLPDGLIARIEEALDIDDGPRERTQRMAQIRDTLAGIGAGVSWAWRGGGLALEQPNYAAAGSREGMEGFRYALGPLATREPKEPAPKVSATRRLWRLARRVRKGRK